MLNIFTKMLLALCSLFLCAQVSVACNISFTAANGANGGQVTFEAAGSQYAGQPARYKYLFSVADNAACGNADSFGINDALSQANYGNTGVTTSINVLMAPSAKSGAPNVLVHSTNGGGVNDFNAFYYTIPTGLSNTTDTFQFDDGNVTRGTVTVTIPAATPDAPTIGTATAGNQQVTVAFTAPASDGGSAIIDYTATSNPGGFTATGAGSPLTVMGLTNGTAYTFTVTARNANGTGTASSASTSVTPKAPQTITFTNPGAKNFGTTPTLTASSTSGLTPTFTSITTGICTITTGGTLTFVTAGSCTINADQSGNAVFSAATTVGQTFTVNAVAPGAPTIGTATAGNGKATVPFTAPASNGGDAITGYTVTSNPGGFTGTGAASPIDVNGLANGTAYTFTVTATNGVGTSTASAASNSVTPAKTAQTITFTNPGTKNFGTTPTLSASATSSLAVTFTSATTSVCTITTGGALTFITGGSCTINADQAGDATYSAAPQVSQTFIVATVPGAPTSPVGTAGSGQVSVAFTAPASNGGSVITSYTVTVNPGGATVSGPASPINVTGLTNGQAYTFTVTATNAVGTSTASVASAAVTPRALQTITFNNPGAQTFGSTPTLTATTSSGLTPTFTSVTTGICTITTGGALTFVTAGNCTINADEAGNGTYLPATTVQQTFIVNPVVPGAPTAAVGTAGGGQVSVAFNAPVYTGGNAIIDYTVTASPGGASATSVASPITVTGLTNGATYTFTVTARNAAGSGPASTASAAVTPKASQTITFANPGSQNFGTTPTLTASASSGLTPVFSSISTSVCTITSGGALTFITAGNCTINVDQAGDSTFGAATTISRTFTVNSVVPGAPTGVVGTAGTGQVSVAFTAPVFTGGSSVTGYTVTASPGGATVSGAISPLVVTGLTNGTAYTFTVTATNSAGTGAASVASAAVTPLLPVGIITFATPASASVLVGNTFTNVATSSLSGGLYGAISYASSNPAVATVNSAGVANAVSAGTSVITATQAAVVGVNAASSQLYTLTVVPGSYSGPTLQGGGTATIAGTGSNSCGFASAQFTPAGAIGALPSGASAAESAFQFDSTNCGVGGTVTITVTYPQPLPYGTMIYKYGPATPGAVASSWFLLTGATLSVDRRTVTYTVTDNGVGDSDPAVGVITDPVVPLVFAAGATAIPTLNEYGLMLLAGLMGMLGIWGQRRRGGMHRPG